jgi:hypothetical protein
MMHGSLGKIDAGETILATNMRHCSTRLRLAW